MCNAWRHFIKDLREGKKENEDDRMRSGGKKDGRGLRGLRGLRGGGVEMST